MEFREAVDVPTRRMTMDRSEMLCDFDLAFWADVLEVLVTEGNNLLLGDKERELIKTLLGELRDLNAFDDSTEIRGDVLQRNTILEQVRLLGISTEAGVRELWDK